jgi:hypothetical protein
MMFIYVYNKLFACTNIVDVLFSRFFISIDRFLPKICLGIARTNFGKNSPIYWWSRPKIWQAKPAEFWDFRIQLFLRRLYCISTEFSQISLIFFLKFSKTDEIAMILIYSVRQTLDRKFDHQIWSFEHPSDKNAFHFGGTPPTLSYTPQVLPMYEMQVQLQHASKKKRTRSVMKGAVAGLQGHAGCPDLTATGELDASCKQTSCLWWSGSEEKIVYSTLTIVFGQVQRKKLFTALL